MSKRFQLWEHDFIRLIYPEFTNKEIGEYLNRSARTITSFASSQKIQKFSLGSLIGERFGKLIVMQFGPMKRKNNTFDCLCDCGNTTNVLLNSLMTGHTQSCGCSRLESINSKIGNITGTWYGSIKRNAESRGYKFDLSKEFLNELLIKQNHKCAISGLTIKIEFCRSSKHYYSNTTASLDRINNELGYLENNVWFVHKDINIMKKDHDIQYFIELCTTIAEFQRGKHSESN